MSETNTTDPAKTARRITRRTGSVTSAAMDKTIVVRIERRVLHPVYKKYVRRFTKLYAHDEKNEAKAGDTVDLVACRPLSKLKRWRLERIVRAGAEGEAP
jgi:small subunit ribosomal protein S17